MRTLIVFALALLMPLAANGEVATPTTGVLEIKVANVEHGSGTVYLAVLSSADGWLVSPRNRSASPGRWVPSDPPGFDDAAIDFSGNNASVEIKLN